MSMSDDDAMSKAGAGRARRVEVFTGAGRRRAWSADEKAAIVVESYVGDVTVCDVARRHGLTPTQLFTWRRAARREAIITESAALFAPALVEAPDSAPPDHTKSEDGAAPQIGFAIAGASVWVCRGAEVEMVTAIIRALKAGR